MQLLYVDVLFHHHWAALQRTYLNITEIKFLLLLLLNMAAIGKRLGWAANDFAHKTCNRYLLKSQNKQGKSAIQASHPPTSFLLGEIKNNELYGAENTADRVAIGGSQESYARVKLTPLFGTVDDLWRNINVAEYYEYIRCNTEDSRHNKTQDCNVENTLPRYRRTLCTARSTRRPQSLGSQRLCWGHGQFVCVRAYSGNGTQSEPLYKTKTGYYEILEVTPTATQVQIKTAYYKQSFIYHPDRNAGSETATVRFSEINEAYTVLGNKALRKKYDRGLLSQSDLVATARTSGKDTAGSSAKHPTESRRSVMSADSRGRVFDFDTFLKAHYHEQLQRERDIRVRKEEMLAKKHETIEEKKLGRMMEIGVGLMLAIAAAILISLKHR